MGASTLNKKDLFRLHMREVEDDYATLTRDCEYYISQTESLQDENARLRELCKKLYDFAWFEQPHDTELNFAEDMKELGIEVKE